MKIAKKNSGRYRSCVMGQPVSVIKAFRIRSKIPNKPTKIIAELSSTHQKKNSNGVLQKEKN